MPAASGTEQRVQTVCLLILSALAIGFMLFWLRSVLVPVTIAVVLTFVLQPVVDVQMRFARLPRALAVITSLLLGVALLSVVVAVISSSVAQVAASAVSYQEQMQLLVEKVFNMLPLERLGVERESVLRDWAGGALGSVGDVVGRVLNAVMGMLSNAVLILIFLSFLLSGVSGGTAGGVRAEIGTQIKKYLNAKLAVSAVTGALVFGVLAVLGIDLALVFGVLAFLLNFVPNVGSVIATLLPVPVVLMSPGITPLAAVLAIAIPGAIQFAVGNVIEPRIMGGSVDLHPVTILAALIFWGVLWGFVGMLLAVPLTATTRILLERLEITAPIGRALAGRWQPRPTAA